MSAVEQQNFKESDSQMEPIRHRDVAPLAEELRVRLDAQRTRIISVDGATGVGKSTLAERLSGELDALHIKVDQFRLLTGVSYVARTDYSNLKSAIETAQGTNRLAIIDSVCVLSVLEKLNLAPDITIFVMPRPHSLESDFLDESVDLENLFQGFRSKGVAYELDREIATYQRSYRPHLRANFQFSRWPER